MFRQILYTQWRWGRLLVLLLMLAAFSVPPLSVQSLGDPTVSRWQISEILSSLQSWGLIYPLLAGGVGLAFAITTWAPDHVGRHVYALSLPLPRWEYALLRFGAGAVLVGAVTLAVLLGALVSVATITPPAGLRSFPFALALRFGLAAFVAYGAFFAISAGTNRTAGYVLTTIGGLILAQVIVTAAGSDVNFLLSALERLLLWPGPLEVFTGRWMLVDV